MNEHFIITAFVLADNLMTKLEHTTHKLARVSDAEILTVALVAAKSFKGNLEHALSAMKLAHFIPNAISISRFNRRIHQLAYWLEYLLETFMGLCRHGSIYVLDSFPVHVCKRVRARRCRKVRGVEYCGYCAAKQEKFFGWRLHLVIDEVGLPANLSMLPAGFHDLTPVHELTFELPVEARVFLDKAYNAKADELSILEETGVVLTPIRKTNMIVQNTIGEMFDLAKYRRRVETVGSQLVAMGLQEIRARTNAGFYLKVIAALFALFVTNALAL